MFEVIRPIERLTIIGLGRSSFDWLAHQYSFPRSGGEVWTINTGGLVFSHDVLWDMHTDQYIAVLPENDRIRIEKRRKTLENHDRPIIMPQARHSHPTSVTFPLKTVVKATNSTYFNNGMAYMLATALCCGVQELSLYGVDFIGEQYQQELVCCNYWLGRLLQSGTKIGPCGSTTVTDNLRPHSGSIYGYHEPIMFDYDTGKPVFSGPDYE